MPLATTQGREFALKALAERRTASRVRKPFANERLMAGSPVYLDCIACGALIEHPRLIWCGSSFAPSAARCARLAG